MGKSAANQTPTHHRVLSHNGADVRNNKCSAVQGGALNHESLQSHLVM